MTRGPAVTGPTELLAAIADIGIDRRRGGYARHGFDRAEAELRDWFAAEAARRGLDCYRDGNGNLWAWWGPPGPNAVVTGSHLDSVPGGGAFDGPLGVAAAFCAVDALRGRGFAPARPLAVVAFAEEEGSRFGVPCLGSRLLCGTVDADIARGLRDGDGVSLAEAALASGLAPERMGRDDDAVARIGCFVELHIEQGRALAAAQVRAPVAVATEIIPHGRWRLRFSGEGNHAGTTEVDQRHDPMLPAAATVLAVRRAAQAVRGARATVGRIEPLPGGTNVIPSTVDLWLDARAALTSDTESVLADVVAAARTAAVAEGCAVEVHEESRSGPVSFDAALREELAGLLGGVPRLPTGAGHDAGVLAARVPTAMLFVRNPTGVSHAPAEFAEAADCAAGVVALTRVLEHLAGAR